MSDTNIRERPAYNKAFFACIGPNRSFQRPLQCEPKAAIEQQHSDRFGRLGTAVARSEVSQIVVPEGHAPDAKWTHLPPSFHACPAEIIQCQTSSSPNESARHLRSLRSTFPRSATMNVWCDCP